MQASLFWLCSVTRRNNGHAGIRADELCFRRLAHGARHSQTGIDWSVAGWEMDSCKVERRISSAEVRAGGVATGYRLSDSCQRPTCDGRKVGTMSGLLQRRDLVRMAGGSARPVLADSVGIGHAATDLIPLPATAGGD
nr:hypothetical protein Iba_chr09dCG12490 [Ipomoea batatas]